MATATQEQAEFASDLAREFVGKAEQRLEELRPALDEAHELEGMISRMRGNAPTEAPAQGRRRSRQSTSGGPSRKEQFLASVQANAGHNVAWHGDQMGVEQKNYLYRVSAQLIQEGEIHKDDENNLYPGPGN